MVFAAVFLVIVLAAPAVIAKDYPVDWTLGKDYSSWTTQSLNVGDKLVFTYDGTHTVDVVSKSDYDNCVSSNAIQANTKSPTSITLKEGTTYIICGTTGHCNPGGMKLQVTTGKAGSGSSPTPSGSTPTPSGSTPTPSGNTPSSPSAAGSSSVGHLMFGVPLVMGILVAFMG